MWANLAVPSNSQLIGDRQPQAEATRMVSDLLEARDSRISEAIGLHGAPVHAIIKACETGVIPTGRADKCAAHLYFYPLAHPDLELPAGFQVHYPTPAEALEHAGEYAKALSRGTLGLQMLGLNPDDDRYWGLGGMLPDVLPDSAIRVLRRSPDLYPDINERAVENACRLLFRSSRGFVLLFGTGSLAVGPTSKGDPRSGDLKLSCPTGLDIKHLVGIVPVSDADRDLVRTLLERAGA